MASWEYCEDFITDHTVCDECKGDLIDSKDPPAELTVYTREGTKFAQHFHKECPNRWCRKTFFYGYTIKNEIRVYEKLNGKKKYLVTSRETAFAIDLCYEMTLHILHNNATFQGLSDVYNQIHNFKKMNIKRIEVNRKRLGTAFFLYGFLEYTSRSGILHNFQSGDCWLENTILEYYDVIKGQFSNHWTDQHFCSVPNCATMMVSDGGMKINRKVCAAKFSAVRKFSNSNKTVLTGCTATPNPDSPFCSDHLHSESPVILAENLSQKTRDRLREYRSQSQKTNIQLPHDSVFIIQSILALRKTKKGFEYSVKFAGFPETVECWEAPKNLPKFIVDYYKKETNLGKQIPGPRIKKTKHLANGTEMYIELEWNQKDDTKEVFETEENLFDIDADKLCEDELKSSCNTRKVRDKRDRRHTAGILISTKPCGIIPHVDELFGCESIKQVHGSIVEFLGTVTPETRNILKLWFFDDMCHLKPYSEKAKNREPSEITELFASLSKAVDKFHFPGHKKTDLYCREKCNPTVELKKLNIDVVNSPACEQAFKWINRFKNLKTMNEAHFKFFLLYMIDLHNLHIENKVCILANPLNEDRDMEILVKCVKFIDLGIKEKPEETIKKRDEKSSEGEKIRLEDCYETDNDGTLNCKLCKGKYKREGHMKNHVETKHNLLIELICKCGQVFDETTRYCRHRKSCK